MSESAEVPDLRRSAFQAGPMPAWLIDEASSRIVDCSDATVRRYGYTREELIGTAVSDLVHVDDLACASAIPRTSSSRWRHRTKPGVLLECEAIVQRFDHCGREFLLVTADDAVEHRKTITVLQDRIELLRSLVSHIPAGVFWKDRSSIYLGCNERYARNMGLSSPGEVIGRTDFELFSQPANAETERASDLIALASQESLPHYEITHTDARGRKIVYMMAKVVRRDSCGTAVGIIGVQQDITEKKQLEEKYLQAQKMEVLGRLCGGVAHDFNNLLTIILGNAELLSQIPLANPECETLTSDIRDAGTRATALTRQLLTFSRKQPFRVEAIDLNEIIRGLVGLLRRLLGERIVIESDLAEGPMTIQADRGQFEQILMNLAVNARDAMPKGGTLRISTSFHRPPQGNNRCVQLRIRDTGVGMSEEVRARIFEPFYSTKSNSHGTGLGLATVWRIVSQANGTIAVHSAPSDGTEFVIDLPRGESTPRSSLVCTPMPIGTATAPSNKNIVLVEDEPSARKMARNALLAHGYCVEDFGNAESALTHLQSAVCDVLITDLVLPRMDGRELADRARELHPRCGIVFVSGYAPDHVRLEGLSDILFLPKPFVPTDIVRMAARMLTRLARGSAAKPVKS